MLDQCARVSSATNACVTRILLAHDVLAPCRVIGLVDGAILVVDAVEGPLAQTKFVLGKALARKLAPLVLLNKVLRPLCQHEFPCL
jgi:hypothetical protein